MRVVLAHVAPTSRRQCAGRRRDDARASLVEHDVRVGRVVREIEMKDRLDWLRLLAGD
jgi:hypothetical protein